MCDNNRKFVLGGGSNLQVSKKLVHNLYLEEEITYKLVGVAHTSFDA